MFPIPVTKYLLSMVQASPSCTCTLLRWAYHNTRKRWKWQWQYRTPENTAAWTNEWWIKQKSYSSSGDLHWRDIAQSSQDRFSQHIHVHVVTMGILNLCPPNLTLTIRPCQSNLMLHGSADSVFVTNNKNHLFVCKHIKSGGEAMWLQVRSLVPWLGWSQVPPGCSWRSMFLLLS